MIFRKTPPHHKGCQTHASNSHLIQKGAFKSRLTFNMKCIPLATHHHRSATKRNTLTASPVILPFSKSPLSGGGKREQPRFLTFDKPAKNPPKQRSQAQVACVSDARGRERGHLGLLHVHGRSRPHLSVGGGPHSSDRS